MNEALGTETQLRKEIAHLHVQIAELERIPLLLSRLDEMSIPLAPAQVPPVPWLTPGGTGPCLPREPMEAE